MKTNQLNETKERKSFKEVLVENKGKIMIGAGIVVSATATYFISKVITNDEKKDLMNKVVELRKKKDELMTLGVQASCLVSSDNADRIDEVEKILIEGGVLDQAVATITRKKDTLARKLICIEDGQGNPDKDRVIKECKRGIEKFNEMLDGCNFIKSFWKDEAVDELLQDE